MGNQGKSRQDEVVLLTVFMIVVLLTRKYESNTSYNPLF